MIVIYANVPMIFTINEPLSEWGRSYMMRTCRHPGPDPRAGTLHPPRWTIGTNPCHKLGSGIACQCRQCQNFRNQRARISGTHRCRAVDRSCSAIASREGVGHPPGYATNLEQFRLYIMLWDQIDYAEFRYGRSTVVRMPDAGA
jgi:hypothetical protein